MRGRGHPQPHSIGFDSTSAIPNSFLPHPSLGSNISNISNTVQSSPTFVKTQFENSQLRCDSIDATPDDAEIKLFGNSSPRSGDLQHCTCNLESVPSLECSIELCFQSNSYRLITFLVTPQLLLFCRVNHCYLDVSGMSVCPKKIVRRVPSG